MDCLYALTYGIILAAFFILYLCRKLSIEKRKRAVKQAAYERGFKVCVVGAGVSGIGAGYALDDMGIKYEIIEKNGEVGGTWHDNIYPGVGCDVQSHLYSFSYVPNPLWSESYSKGPEIFEYIKKVAEPVRSRITFNTCVVRATWKDNISKWVVELSSGRVMEVDVIVTGTGLLHKPSTPKFSGSELFQGVSFHTSQWNKDISMTGKKVGVVGTGATAVQAVPSIADMGVESLTVFQRTATWVNPRFDYKYSEFSKTVFNYIPLVRLLYRWCLFWSYELRLIGLFIIPSKHVPIVGKLHSMLQQLLHYYVKTCVKYIVKDQEVAEKLIPDIPLGCKRITPSDSYLQAFNKDNVHLVTEKIQELNARGIQTVDNKTHDLDVIIYATGFDLIDSANAFEVLAVGERSLAEAHSDAPQAYYGCTHHLCPNYYMLGGPGVFLGHNSVIFISECQINYIKCGIEELLLRKASSVCLKERSMDLYQEWAQNKMKNKVFEGDKYCTGWYRNSRGINWTFWPTNLTTFWWNTLSFDSGNYLFTY